MSTDMTKPLVAMTRPEEIDMKGGTPIAVTIPVAVISRVRIEAAGSNVAGLSHVLHAAVVRMFDSGTRLVITQEVYERSTDEADPNALYKGRLIASVRHTDSKEKPNG